VVVKSGIVDVSTLSTRVLALVLKASFGMFPDPYVPVQIGRLQVTTLKNT